MVCSLLTICRNMDQADPTHPLSSLRELSRRHRWLGGGPPDPLSLRTICARHHHPMHRVLWYNTFLIHGFQLSLCNAIQIGRILPALPAFFTEKLIGLVTPQELVDTFDITTEALANAFDIGKDALVEKFPSVIDSFVEKSTSWIPGVGSIVKIVKKAVSDISRLDILGKLSPYQLIDEFEFMTPDQIVAKLGLDIGQLATAFCDRFLGLLSDYSGVPLDATIDVKGAAPDRPMRAVAIGKMLANDEEQGKRYDIACLCEVFEPDRQADLISAASSSGRKTAAKVGPQADGEMAGSGLVTMTFDALAKGGTSNPLDDLLKLPDLWLLGSENNPKAHVFSNQGDRLKDADAWSRKGVLLTVVDLGFGKVDVYSTHLYKGGDIGILGDPSDAEIWNVKTSQVDEIVEFIADTRTAEHVAILMGDFNISASDSVKYQHLVNRLAAVDLVDLWPFWREPQSGSKPLGSTDDPATVCVDNHKPFCREPDAPTGARIDYVFVQRPLGQHGFTLDFTRMRRRAFQFNQSEVGFLSDHVGLDFSLLASPLKN